jgi:hypothetical protein
VPLTQTLRTQGAGIDGVRCKRGGRVSVQIQGGTVVQTIPIVVLGIDKAYCTGPSTKPCYQNPPSPTLHYLGVGFNRNSTAPGDLFNSPTANVVARLIVRR